MKSILDFIADDNYPALVMGGSFQVWDGVFRDSMSAVSATPSSSSVEVTPLNPLCVGGTSCIAVSGSTVYIGGQFSNVCNTTQSRAAAVSTSSTPSGDLLGWNPVPNNPVNVLVVSGGTVYMGGIFTTLNGTSRVGAGAVDSGTGSLLTWKPIAAGTNVMILNGADMYLGGNFSTINAVQRFAIGAVSSDPNSAITLRNWNPVVSAGAGVVNAMVLSGPDLYVGGQFTTVASGRPRNRVAAFTSSTSTSGDLTAWNPNANNTVRSLALNGSDMFIGGDFTTINSVPRTRIAAVNATTSTSGALLAFAPSVGTTSVYTIIADSAAVYFAGDFTTVNGIFRYHAAAMSSDTSTAGNLLNWNANPYGGANTAILKLVRDGNYIYIAGPYTTVGSRLTCNPVSIESEPNSNYPLKFKNLNGNLNTGMTSQCAVISGNDLYIGGSFTNVSGISRNKVAAVSIDPNNFSVRNWDPNCNANCNVLVLSGGTMYLGGPFTTVNGQARNGAAAFTSNTSVSGSLLTWNPNCATSTNVTCMVLNGADMYLGGAFTKVNGSTRNRVAAVSSDPNSAITLRAWDPNCNGQVNCMVLNGSYMFIGGNFSTVSAVTRLTRVVAYSADTSVAGALSSWDPGLSFTGVNALALSGPDLIVGGISHLRAYSSDASTAAVVRSWVTATNFDVQALYVSGNVIYVGNFNTSAPVVNGYRRNGMAFSADTSIAGGKLLNWSPMFGNFSSYIIGR